MDRLIGVVRERMAQVMAMRFNKWLQPEEYDELARAALAALQREWAVVPREYEAAMASSGPRSGHSVEVQFKDREGALEFYSALKGLGSDWVQRQLDYIAARKKAAPQTEEPL